MLQNLHRGGQALNHFKPFFWGEHSGHRVHASEAVAGAHAAGDASRHPALGLLNRRRQTQPQRQSRSDSGGQHASGTMPVALADALSFEDFNPLAIIKEIIGIVFCVSAFDQHTANSGFEYRFGGFQLILRPSNADPGQRLRFGQIRRHQ